MRFTRRPSVDFVALRVSPSSSISGMNSLFSCIQGIVERLLRRNENVTGETIQHHVDLLLGRIHTEFIAIPFMFPNADNSDVRRILWPICMQLMQNMGIAHLRRRQRRFDRQFREVQQRSLLDIPPVPVANKHMCKQLTSKRYDRVRTNLKRKRVKESCVVCLDNFRINSRVKQMPKCGHVFHSKCLDNCLMKTALKCPTCRTPVVLVSAVDTV